MAQTFDVIKKYLLIEAEKMRRSIDSNEDVVFNYNLDVFMTILQESNYYYDFVKAVEKSHSEFFVPLYAKTMGNLEWMQQLDLIV
jgi:hypothetical protein